MEPQYIEEDGSVIHIRQAVKVVKGTVSIGSPKSKDSIRDIPVPLNVRLLTPHSCRHTYVSQMQALGVDIQTIQSIVGHADTEMTEHYLHVQESIRQSAIQLFNEAFSA